jgi:hypothetical protein
MYEMRWILSNVLQPCAGLFHDEAVLHPVSEWRLTSKIFPGEVLQSNRIDLTQPNAFKEFRAPATSVAASRIITVGLFHVTSIQAPPLLLERLTTLRVPFALAAHEFTSVLHHVLRFMALTTSI